MLQSCPDHLQAGLDIRRAFQESRAILPAHHRAHQFALADKLLIMFDERLQGLRFVAVALRHTVVFWRGLLMDELLDLASDPEKEIVLRHSRRRAAGYVTDKK